jgi:hypothetical protein
MTVVRAMKDIKSSIKGIEEKGIKIQNEDIQEIIKIQKILEEIIIANSNAIKKIYEEIKSFQNDKAETGTFQNDDTKAENNGKKLRYCNKGYCKYKFIFKFSYPTEICKNHLEGKKCDISFCKMRHPKTCKWLQGKSGCRRYGCIYQQHSNCVLTARIG